MKYLYAMMLCVPLLQADFVELRDGRRFEGTILAERSDGIEIQIGQNDAGTIKRVLHIHASEVKSYAADAAGRQAQV